MKIMKNGKITKADAFNFRLDPLMADAIRQIAERDHQGNMSQAMRALLSKAVAKEATTFIPFLNKESSDVSTGN